MKKQMGKIGIFLACLFLMLPGKVVKAEETLEFSNFESAGDTGGNVTVECAKDSSALLLEYQFDKEGYHTVTAFQNDDRALTGLREISFVAENQSDVPVRMNFQMIDENGKVAEVQDGTYVVLKGDEESFSLTEQGCFLLPEGFSGSVEIPLALFAPNGELPEKIFGYGFVCVAENQNNYQMTISKLCLKEEGINPEDAAFLEIEGEDTVRKGDVGESESYYVGRLYNLFGEAQEVPVTLSLREEQEQVEIKDGNCLLVKAGAKADSVMIEAKTADGFSAEKEVALAVSWTETVHTDNGYDASVAAPEEIAPVSGYFSFLTEKKSLWILRGLAVCAAAVTLIYYNMVRSRERRRQ